jgi:dienelactone hydrolase
VALFEYFPNYIWNLSVAIAIESGAPIGEIMDIVGPVKEAANSGADAGTQLFMAQWNAKADTLIGLAAEDEARGRLLSAGAKLQRAALYLFNGERMLAHGATGRREAFAKAHATFQKAMALSRENCERVLVPVEGGMMPALYTRAPGAGRRPVVVFCNGLDSNKELLYWTRLPEALARRGISTLCVDQPGTGETLRLQGLPATFDSERWAAKAVDWLELQPDVDRARIGMVGISLGGHYVPRAVAFEPRFASGAVWGANHNWAEVQQKRLRREGENPVPHYWAHVMWVFGASDMDDFLRKAEGMTLNGVMERIKVPFLVTHGESDRQIPLDYARQSYEQLTASPQRELKVFTPREGGVEHVGADNMGFGRDYIADWFADTLAGHLA